MNIVDTKEAAYDLISRNRMVLMYFGSDSCNVCNAIKPKVEEILKNYAEIISYQVDTEKDPEVSAEFNIFTIPGILLFIDGKEIIREARHISIQELDSKIERYYNLLFQ